MAEAPRERAVMEDVVRALGGVVWGGAGLAAVVGGVSGGDAEPLVVGDGVLGLDSGCVAWMGGALPAAGQQDVNLSPGCLAHTVAASPWHAPRSAPFSTCKAVTGATGQLRGSSNSVRSRQTMP